MKSHVLFALPVELPGMQRGDPRERPAPVVRPRYCSSRLARGSPLAATLPDDWLPGPPPRSQVEECCREDQG